MATAPEPFPDLDWSAERARAFTDRAAALQERFLRELRGLPVARSWRRGEVAEAVTLPVPARPLGDDELFEHVERVMFERSMYPGHPRFVAYITGPGTVPGPAADLLASTINQNLGGWRLSPAATDIELHLTRWFGERFGLPETAAGLVTSGGAMATFIALKTARDRHAGWDTRDEGLRERPQLTMYASEEVHAVTRRAADMLGVGMNAVRLLPVDDAFRLRVDALEEAIRRDREDGQRPFAVVASAGTVATGAIDPLPDVADVCAREDLWMHVDGAYGGPAVLADDLRPLLDGIERADSIAFDPHKWLYVPHSAGCVLFRDISHAFDAFDLPATYTVEDREATGTVFDFGSHGPQWSRGFQAFKIWLSLLAHGTDAYARRISHDAALARYLGARVEERPEFELVTPVSLSICCFRYLPAGLPPDLPDRDAYLDRLNERLMTRLQLDGRVYPSNAVLRGRFVLRACIVNFRTEASDLDALLDVAAEVGQELDEDLRRR